MREEGGGGRWQTHAMIPAETPPLPPFDRERERERQVKLTRSMPLVMMVPPAVELMIMLSSSPVPIHGASPSSPSSDCPAAGATNTTAHNHPTANTAAAAGGRRGGAGRACMRRGGGGLAVPGMVLVIHELGDTRYRGLTGWSGAPRKQQH